MPKSKSDYDIALPEQRRPINVNDVRSAPILPAATYVGMEHAPTFGIHRFQNSEIL